MSDDGQNEINGFAIYETSKNGSISVFTDDENGPNSGYAKN